MSIVGVNAAFNANIFKKQFGGRGGKEFQKLRIPNSDFHLPSQFVSVSLVAGPNSFSSSSMLAVAGVTKPISTSKFRKASSA